VFHVSWFLVPITHHEEWATKKSYLAYIVVVTTILIVVVASLPFLIQDPAESLYEDAQKLIAQGDYVNGREQAQALIDRFPDDFYAIEYGQSMLSECDYNIAEGLRNKQEYAQAIEKYQQVLTYSHTDMMDNARYYDAKEAIGDSYFGWAQLLQSQKNYAEAIDMYQSGWLAGNYSEVQNAVGQCCYGWIADLVVAGKYDEAVQKYLTISDNYTVSSYSGWDWTRSDTADVLNDVPAENLFAWATKLKQEKSYDDAIVLFKTIMQYNPGSQYAAESEKPLIETEVAQIEEGTHNFFPPPAQTEQTQQLGGEAEYTIINKTSYTLTILLIGPTTRSIDVSTGATQKVTVQPGTYKLAAKVNNSGVTPYYGQTTFFADVRYEGTYYIETRYG
jgi:tetratricopeptide (TPR) repeat protein